MNIKKTVTFVPSTASKGGGLVLQSYCICELSSKNKTKICGLRGSTKRDLPRPLGILLNGLPSKLDTSTLPSGQTIPQH